MSFDMETDFPEYKIPPNTCPACFGLNKTPNFLIVFYSGIKIGALWNPGDPPPPNGLHTAMVAGPCHFNTVGPVWEIDFRFIGGRTHCTLTHAVVGEAFSSNVAGICHIWCLNEHVNPAITKYYDGQCISISPLSCDSNNYPDIMDLFSDHPDWARYLNARSAAEMTAFYNLYKANSQVNIKIKIDHS